MANKNCRKLSLPQHNKVLHWMEATEEEEEVNVVGGSLSAVSCADKQGLIKYNLRIIHYHTKSHLSSLLVLHNTADRQTDTHCGVREGEKHEGVKLPRHHSPTLRFLAFALR